MSLNSDNQRKRALPSLTDNNYDYWDLRVQDVFFAHEWSAMYFPVNNAGQPARASAQQANAEEEANERQAGGSRRPWSLSTTAPSSKPSRFQRTLNLPGTTADMKQGGRDRVHMGNDTREVCRNFAAGKCRKGNKCRFLHVEKPKFQGTCNHCGKKGHKEANCYKKKRDEKDKATAGASGGQQRTYVAEEKQPGTETMPDDTKIDHRLSTAPTGLTKLPF